MENGRFWLASNPLIAMISLAFVTLPSFANPLISTFKNYKKFSGYVVTASGGYSWANAGQTQTFNLQQTVQNTYAADNSARSFGNGELFLTPVMGFS